MDKIDAYVFYHSADFDGYLSCVLIACYLKYNNKKFALKSYNYGNPLDIDSLDKTPSLYLETESIKTIAGSSPPVKT